VFGWSCGIDQGIANDVAVRIVKSVAEIGNGVGCSVGISLVANTDSIEIETAIWLADEAMYEAKM
jgi:GGDEF domain-containing protein